MVGQVVLVVALGFLVALMALGGFIAGWGAAWRYGFELGWSSAREDSEPVDRRGYRSDLFEVGEAS